MRLIIIGAGGYGKTVADIARQSGKYDSVDFLDDNESLDYTIGKCSDYKYLQMQIPRFIRLSAIMRAVSNG